MAGCGARAGRAVVTNVEPLVLRVPVRTKAWSIDHWHGEMRHGNLGVHVHVFRVTGGINGRIFVE
jgi:hypothetical protein